MSRARKISLTAILLALAAGLAGWGWFLSRQDLEGADQWSSVASFIASLPLGVLGVVFGFLAWRDGRPKETPTGSTFTVSAGRDAYTAEQMTFNYADKNHRDDGPSA